MFSRIWALAYAFALATSPALAHDGAHVAAPGLYETAPGVRGDVHDVTSTIRVRMLETADGRMAFDPAAIVARHGETLRIVLENDGTSVHEFVLGTRDELADHARMMRDMPGMSHDEPNAVRLQPGVSGELIWRFGGSDGIAFACLVPGHYEAGMRGEVRVPGSAIVDRGKTSSVSRAAKWAKRTRWGQN